MANQSKMSDQENEKKSTHIMDLPTEILDHIISFLPKRTKLYCTSVNKRLCDIGFSNIDNNGDLLDDSDWRALEKANEPKESHAVTTDNMQVLDYLTPDDIPLFVKDWEDWDMEADGAPVPPIEYVCQKLNETKMQIINLDIKNVFALIPKDITYQCPELQLKSLTHLTVDLRDSFLDPRHLESMLKNSSLSSLTITLRPPTYTDDVAEAMMMVPSYQLVSRKLSLTWMFFYLYDYPEANAPQSINLIYR